MSTEATLAALYIEISARQNRIVYVGEMWTWVKKRTVGPCDYSTNRFEYNSEVNDWLAEITASNRREGAPLLAAFVMQGGHPKKVHLTNFRRACEAYWGTPLPIFSTRNADAIAHTQRQAWRRVWDGTMLLKTVSP